MISTPSVSPNLTTEPVSEVSTDNHVIPSMVPVFLIISIVALVGNLLVVFLFIRNRSWLKKAHSNLILALAVTDILTAVCILVVPLFIHEADVFPVPQSPIARELYCRVVWSHYLVFSLGVTSVYICVFLAIERWLAIGKPLFYKQHLHSKRNIALMVILPWLAGFAFESAAVIRTTGVVLPDGTTSCKWSPDTLQWSTRVIIAVVSFLGMIFLPGLLVIVTYIHILIKVRKTFNQNSDREHASKRRKSDFKRVTLMAAVASIVLVICWLPGQFYFMLSQMGYAKVHVISHRWLNVLALSSACFNPFIYAFWNPKYREGFKAELAMLMCCKRHHSQSYSLTPPSGEHSFGVNMTRKDGMSRSGLSCKS